MKEGGGLVEAGGGLLGIFQGGWWKVEDGLSSVEGECRNEERWGMVEDGRVYVEEGFGRLRMG